jgi:ZIP family zinc transporter
MVIVALTALGVGGATIIGALLGFLFKNSSQKIAKILLAFAGGIMLSAAVFGLILPSLEHGGKFGILITIAGIFVGAFTLKLIDKFTPHLHKMIGKDIEEHSSTKLSKVLLFVIAIAIHNFPEGIAAGVATGLILVFLKDHNCISWLPIIVAICCGIAFVMSFKFKDFLAKMGQEKKEE